MNKRVAVLGASKKKDRYSNKAIRKLIEKGYEAVPINPVEQEIERLKVYAGLKDMKETADTVTMYVNPKQGEKLIADIIAVKPKRVIFNPGTESKLIVDKLTEAGILCIEACTLVLLSTNQFDNSDL